MIDSISNAFTNGGIWMWVILAVQIVSIAIIVERVIQLFVIRKGGQKKVIRSLERDIKSGNLSKAMQPNFMQEKMNPIYKVVRAGATAASSLGGRQEVQSKMDEILLDENEKLEKRTTYLSMLGNVGTLLGLLGTIVGLIEAFGSVSNVDPVQKAQLLTQGISMAMNTTAYGLIMAIPALVMYAVLQNRANTLSEDLNQAALRAFNWFSFNQEVVAVTESSVAMEAVSKNKTKTSTRKKKSTRE